MTQSNGDYRQVPNSLAGVLILAGGKSTRMGQPKALMALPTGQTLLDYHVQAAKSHSKPIFIADNGQGFVQRQHLSDAQVQAIEDYCPPSTTPKPLDADHPKNEHSIGPLGAILSALQQLDAFDSKTIDSKTIDSKTIDSKTIDSKTIDSKTIDSKTIDSEAFGLENKASKYNKPSFVLNRWLVVVSCDSLVNATDIWQWVPAHTCFLDSIEAPASVICLTDNTNRYPLLGLYRLDIAEDLKSYLDSGQRRVMRFVDPISQTVLMPEDWQPLSNLNTPSQFEQAVALSDYF